ncbi:Hypothetical predicted protein [Mytilus galloprovincialis]|uniref:ABC transporter domain-containing protein n=1 Tax=Mytilus galloprovincialis TaxID=29158 RepID=A0A8B6EQV5_MYTGA|nr:Hypothetical predicted protein [Mytilus galloprovincialis]
MADKRYVPLYLKLLESGSEKKRDIRLVIVGKKGAGKTLLIKRLFKEVKKETGIINFLQEITRRKKESTNGIEIHRIRCKATVDDDKWEKLDANYGEAELNARLLKPYEEKVSSAIGNTSEAPGEASVHKLTKDETAVTICEATRHELSVEKLIVLPLLFYDVMIHMGNLKVSRR